MKKYLLISVVLFFSISLNSQKKSIDSLTKDMKMSKGILNSYTENNKIFFEVPEEILGKEILVVTRLAQVPSGYSPYINAGSKTSEQVISFFKKNNKLDIKQLSYNNIADSQDPISLSVTENNFSPILASFEIKNNDKDSYLIDISDYFLNDSPGFDDRISKILISFSLNDMSFFSPLIDPLLKSSKILFSCNVLLFDYVELFLKILFILSSSSFGSKGLVI